MIEKKRNQSQSAPSLTAHFWLGAFLPVLFAAKGALADARPDKRIEALIARMTIEEKIGQLTQFSIGRLTGPGDRNATIEKQEQMIREGRLGSILNLPGAAATNRLQHLAVDESRLKIPLLIGMDIVHGYRTTFPDPIAEANSWDIDLVEKTAAAAAAEMSADGIRWTFAPMVDVGRDARWGRVAEGAGEDVFLGSAIAAARVRGFQGRNPAGPWKVMATAKHFAAYGLPEAGRDYASVDISETTLRTIYLPPFHAAVKAGLGSIMTSFNEISGIPSTANHFLLTDVLRKEWGFDGMVVSDWGSVDELVRHGLVANRTEAAREALLAGNDMDMASSTYFDELPQLVRDRVVPMPVLDEAVRRVLRAKIRLGLFENPYTDPALVDAAQLRPETRALALTAARESIVLLKNEGELLPLSKEFRNIALVGPFVDAQLENLGCWKGNGKAEYVVTLLAAMKMKFAGTKTNLQYALGTDFRGKKKNIDEAVQVARRADVVVMFVGDPGWNTGENNSKTSLDLSAPQKELVQAVAATGKPIVMLLMGGAPVTVPWEAEHIPAIVETWTLGVEAGNAIADVLVGDQVPGGKLVMTFPRNVGQVPIHYDHKSSGRPPEQQGGSRYSDSPSTPLWPFGFGLSYTKFEYSDLKVSAPEIPVDGSVVVEASVKNVGPRTGVEVAQLYVQDVAATLTRPVKELRGFSRLELAPGESRRVAFTLGPQELGMWNRQNRFVVEPGVFKVWVGTDSSDGIEGEFRAVSGAGRKKIAAR